uniref:Uncharacterized protein n=1 Tax=Tanacetum cinerariifolium TaxID=118510 RepID=A0A699HNB1_TANCI|nr:hypothetical protein [Tanacetum cinerariifolium]
MDHPPLLAMGRYAQWQSRVMRYVNTKPNGDSLRKCILEVEEQTVFETLSNMSSENKAQYDAEKEVIDLILTRIGDEIYSTIDACKTAHEIWIAIKRYKNDNQTGPFRNQRTMTIADARETIGSQLEDTDEEVDKQELEAHYIYMAKIQEVPTIDLGPSFNAEPLEEVHSNDDYNVFANEKQHFKQLVSIDNTCVVKKVDSNVILNSSDMCDNENHSD